MFNFRLQGFVLMWKKNGNIISVGNQILGNVSRTVGELTKILQFNTNQTNPTVGFSNRIKRKIFVKVKINFFRLTPDTN